MHIAEHLERAQKPLFSFEIVPPSRGHTVNEIISVIHQLLPHNPSWIDVTSHAPHAQYREKADGTIERVVHRKRPGTLGICGVIQNRFKIDTVAHLLCLGFTREETEDALIELNYLGVHNVLALRGDGPNYEKRHAVGKTINRYAIDLVEQVNQLNQGLFLSNLEDAQALNFCVGVAGYPEKHFESPNLRTDISFLKQKIEAGAGYVVTQMFFENAHYFRFVESCREAGISIPIVPGLKVLRGAPQLSRIPRTFHCDLPDHLVEEIGKNPEHAEEIGVNHSYEQCLGLLEFGVPSLHFYVLNDANAIDQVMKKLKKHL